MSTLEAAHDHSPFAPGCNRVAPCHSHDVRGILSFPSTFHDTCLCGPDGPDGPFPCSLCAIDNPCLPCSIYLDLCSHHEACHVFVEDGPAVPDLPFSVGSSHMRVS